MIRPFIFPVIISLLLLGTFISCKKYPEGGRRRRAERSLRGGLNDEYMKQWVVTQYEVDGVDSTKTWKSGKSTDRFSYYHVQISTHSSGLSIDLEGTSYIGQLVNDDSVLRITEADEKLKGINCYRTSICERNIFMPLGNGTPCDWQILLLDENNAKFVLTDKRQYTIKLEYADQE